jgi:predicted transcriptional regulator
MSDYARFQKIMQEENKKGLVRATARSILYQDIKAGKIKGMTFEQLGSAKDPIEDFRKIYGEMH